MKSWIEKQDWKVNRPDPARVVSLWKPTGTVDSAMDSKAIQRMVRRQKWKGLCITDLDGKGKGVLTTRPFSKGEVVCDYHGVVVSREQGLAIHQSTEGKENGHMLFYTSRGVRKCIDAHLDRCVCHPEKPTYGRHINHSRKRSNVRPRVCKIQHDGQEQDIILFFATRDIKVSEELLFDHGVKRRQFTGEGLDLEWL